jgi:hypothetical protein
MYSLPDCGPLLTAADFEPYVGQTFLVDARPRPLQIRLDKIVCRRDSGVVSRQPFILIFTTPWNDLLLSAVYRMQPNGGHPVEMCLVPTQTEPGDRRYYHAVFN